MSSEEITSLADRILSLLDLIKANAVKSQQRADLLTLLCELSCLLDSPDDYLELIRTLEEKKNISNKDVSTIRQMLSDLEQAEEDDDDFFSPEIIDKFVQECFDLLNGMEELLIKLAGKEESPEIINELYRHTHTFKGNCGFMGFDQLQDIAHSFENRLSDYKELSTYPESNAIQVYLMLVDLFKAEVQNISAGKGTHLENYQDILNEIEKLEAPAVTAGDLNSLTDLDDRMLELYSQESGELLDDAENAIMLPNQDTEAFFRAIHSLKGNAGAIHLQQLHDLFHTLETKAATFRDEQLLNNNKLVLDLAGCLDLSKLLIQSLKDPVLYESTLNELNNAVNSLSRPSSSAVQFKLDQQPVSDSQKSLRVDLSKLDQLVNLVGEIIIAESLVTKHPELEQLELKGFDRSAHQLHRLVQDLHHLAMAVRMTQVSTVFKRMNRLVLDLANKSGKSVSLQLSGEETEIDKGICDIITDPLIHMIRNSVDHGLESAAERTAAGKNPCGSIHLQAVQKPNEILIIIEDDGRGLNKESILAKALKTGLVDHDNQLKDGEIYNLIFEPGFSTSDTVTDISGRGVGMDVVRKKIESVNGRIEISSKLGEGTRFDIHLPLSLAIIEGMLVEVGCTKFTIPITAIRQSFKPHLKDITIRPDGQEFITVREKVLPVFRLHRLHDIPDAEMLPENSIFIILEIADGQVCLMVDNILHQVQTVIKSLGNYMGFVKGISGCNILGNGEVALILDPEVFNDMLDHKATVTNRR